MKKILLILIAFLPFLAMAQLEGGEYINADTVKKGGVPVYLDHLQNLSKNDSNFVAVNFGTYVDWVDIISRIDNLDSLGILSTDIQAGEQSINSGTTSITFPGAFDSTDLDISVVPYVRRTSDNAVIDYVVDNISTTGFDVTVWEDNCFIRYIASQKNPESNSFFETLLHDSDTATIIIDTSQVRNLQTFVENHSTGGSTTNSIKITYTGIPQSPLMLPLSTNSIAIVSVDSATGQQTYTGIDGPVLDNFSYTENSEITGNLITSFSFDDLIGVESSLSFSGLYSCTSFSSPKLKYVGGALTIGTMAACTNISLDSLYYVNGNSVIGTMANIPRIILPNLNFSTGNITIANCASLTTIKLPSVVFFKGVLNVTNGNGNIVYLQFSNVGTLKGVLGIISAQNQKLSQGTVDSLLWTMCSLDGTNGTVAYNSTINISGGTSAAPTFTGSTVTQAGSSFVGSGTTCTVSWVGHGYTTGDLLTISGITTLTNANGTFEITVDNLNQFHYTITSQTATGAGTATVKKAGSTTEGYYYKQLLQVRGATVITN